jgi:hypothetical protein
MKPQFIDFVRSPEKKRMDIGKIIDMGAIV